MLLRIALGLAVLAAPTVAAQPDLTISAVAEDSAGDAGDRVTVEYTAVLTGAEEIEDVPVGFYFSSDLTFSPDDTFSEREEVDTEAGNPESDSEQIGIPASLADGEYFLLVVIDDLDVVAESDETNNTEAIPFTVGDGGSAGGDGADLTVTSVSTARTGATPGTQVEGEYALANLGSEQAGSSSVGFYLSTDTALSANDTFLTSEDADEVDANGDGDGDFEFAVPSSLAAGDYFLLAVADNNDVVSETNESNNVASTPFSVTGQGGGSDSGDADLEVTAASVLPSSADAGAQVEVSYTLANTGSTDAAESQVGIYVSTDPALSSNDVLITRNDGDSVESGDSEDSDEDVTVPSSLAPGDYFVLFVADDKNTVGESDESNNTTAVPFAVTGDGTGGGGGQADLRITSVSVDRAVDAPGAQQGGEFTLVNAGTEQAGASVVSIYFSTDSALSSGDTFLASVEVDEVDAGGDASGDFEFTVPTGLAPGKFFVLAVADDGNDVTETKESNNTLFRRFRVVDGDRPKAGGAAAPLAQANAAVRFEGVAPNPATDRATVRFALADAGPARLAVIDALGREVAILVEGSLSAGAHDATWDAARLAPGLYVLRLDAAGETIIWTATVAR